MKIKTLGLISLLTVSFQINAEEAPSFIETWYAEEFNVSIETASDQIKLGNKAREIANILELESGKFGGMIIENTPKFRITFNVKRPQNCKQSSPCNNDFEAGMRKTIKQNKWQSFAKINHTNYSLDDLRESQNEILSIVEQYATDGFEIDASQKDGSITLKVINVTEFEEALRADEVTLPNNVETAELEEVMALSAFGGGINGLCTFGFVVKDSKGVKGLSTAEHCGATANWSGQALTHRGSITSRDTQWFELPEDQQSITKNLAVSHTYQGNVSFTPIKGTTVLGVGNAVCKFGAETDRTCGVVTAVNRLGSGTNPITGQTKTYGNLTVVSSNGKAIAAGGDSGGPFYSGNNAVGQVVGSSSTATYYTPVANITAMGISILTQ